MADENRMLLLEMDAKIAGLVNQMKKAAGETDKQLAHIEKQAEGSMNRLEKLFGKADFGEAFEKTFSRARLGVFEEGGAKIGIFGSALEALGPAGLAAAAGLAATGVALEFAKSGAEYAEQIQNTADKLGITTTALQQYNFVALASGVSTEAMEEALQSGNERLGEFQSNIGSARVKKVFQALGITPEEAAKAHTILDLLPQISAKMQGLSAAEQTAVAKRAGLEGIIEVMRKGPAAIADLREEAQRTGVVLDADLIQKGKEAGEAIKTAADAVDKNLKRAFINLAPVLADALKIVAEIAKKIADLSEDMQGVQSFSSQHVTSAQGQVDSASAATATAARFFGSKIDPATGKMVGGGATGAMGLNAYYNALQGQRAQLNAQGKYHQLSDGIAEMMKTGGTSKQLVPDKTAKGPSDQTDDFNKTASDDADVAKKELDAARAALTKNIMAHADFEKRAVDDDAAKKLKDLSDEELKIRKSKNDKQKADQLALIEQAKTDTQGAAIAKKELIDREAAEAQAKADLDFDLKQQGYRDAIMSAQASIAKTAQQRADLELQVFKDAQSAALERLRQEDASKVASGEMSQGDMDTDVAGQRSADNAELLAKREQEKRSSNPLYAYSAPTSGIGEDFQNIEVKGLQDLNTDLTDAIMHTKNLQQAFHATALSIAADLVKMGVQRLVTQPLASALFSGQNGFGNSAATGGQVSVGPIEAMSAAATAAASSLYALASSAGMTPMGASGVGSNGWYGLGNDAQLDNALSNNGMDPSGGSDLNLIGKGISSIGGLASLFGLPGLYDGTDDAQGGPTLVGEDGPELVNLPAGAGVTSNNALRSINGIDPSKMQRSSVNQTFHMDFSGAVVTEDLMRQANAYTDRVGQGAVAASVGLSRKIVPNDINRGARASFVR